MMTPEDTNAPKTTETQVPQPTAPVVTPTPQLSRKPSKKLIIILSIVGAVVVFAGIAAILYGLLFSVSKADYRTAANTTSEVSSAGSKSYTAVSKVAYISTSTTDIEIKENATKARELLATYKEEGKKLADVKALRDGEVKDAYDAYDKKFNEFVAFSEAYIDSAEKVMPAIAICEEIGRSSSSAVGKAAFDAAIAPCEEALNKVTDVKDKDLATFLSAYKKNVADTSAVVARGEGATNAEKIKLRTELSKITSDLRAAQREGSASVSERLKAVRPYDTLSSLYDLTADKSK